MGFNEMIDEGFVDLSLGLSEEMLTYPTEAHCRFQAKQLGYLEVHGRNTHQFSMGSHCGTHVDAMYHFSADGETIDQFMMDDLIGPALLIDLGSLDPGTVIDSSKLAPQVEKYSPKRLVIQTNWDRFWNTDQYYDRWPYLSDECTRYIASKQIKLLALDFPSPDSAYFGNECSLDSPNHKTLFKHEIILVEYLTNLKSLRPGLIFLIVSPLKLLGFDGAPARVSAKSCSHD